MEYVNVVLLHHGEDEIVTGGVSKEDGSFMIEGAGFGQYDIQLSFIGFKTKIVEKITLDDSGPVADLGTVRLEPGDEAMGGVTVKGEREMLSVNLDKQVFVVDRDISTTGDSALEIMESLPSVNVDHEGRVSLRGSTNVTILVDGRPSHLTSLDQMPATMVDRVEVITNPSARYDPDGTSGIINIVMKKERQAGTGGMASVNMGTGDKYNGSVNLNHRRERFNIFGNYDFRIHSTEGYNINERERIRPEGDTIRQMYQFEDFLRDGTFHNMRLGTDFFIDPERTLTVMGLFNLRDTRPRNYSQVNLFAPEQYDMSTSMERQFEGFGREYVLNYARDFEQEGREFEADLFYAVSDGETNRDIIMEPDGNDMENQYMYEESYAPGTVFTLQADYAHPVGENSRIEAGVKSIFRDMEDDFKLFDKNNNTGEYEVNDDYTNHFLYDESIHAAYGIYGFALGDFHFQGGFRAEQHSSDAKQKVTGEEFDRSFFNVFPSAHLKYSVDDKNALSLDYSRRVNRPSISMLNPFVNYSDPLNVSFGNPELKPEYINSYELGYQYAENRKEFSTVLFYRETEDMITRDMTLGGNEQTRTTFENLKSGTSFGVEFVANYPLTPWWRINSNLSYFYTYLEDESLPDWEHEGDTWMFDVTSNWNFLERYNVQARFHYHAPQVTEGRTTGGGCQSHGGQGVLGSSYYLDLGLRANVLEGNGTISLRLSDVFKTRGTDMYTYGETFTSDLTRRRESRVLFLGFTYRFNEYRERSDRDREGSLLDQIE